MILLDVTGDVLSDVFACWLYMSDVVGVDSACCFHASRPHFLCAIRAAVYDFIHPSMDPSLPVLVHTSNKKERMEQSVRLFMKWVVQRSLSVRTFMIVFGIVSSANRADYLRLNGRLITSIRFEDNNEGSRTWKAQAVHDVCAFCPNITHIDVPAEGPIDGYEKLPAVISVCFKRNACSRVAFAAVVKGCPLLTSIEILPPVCFSLLLPMLPPNLLHIHLSTGYTTTEMLDALTSACPLLRTLMVQDSTYWCTDELLQRFATRCPFLEAIRIGNGYALRRAGMQALGQAGRLTFLDVDIPGDGGPLHPAYFTAMGKILPLNPNLHTLRSPADTTLLHSIAAHAPQLQHLSMTARRLPFQPNLLESILAVVQSCTQLRTLYLDYYIVQNEVLVALGAHSPHLVAFAASFGYRITDAGVCALAQGCRQLREVSATTDRHYLRAPVTMVGITALATHCPHLRELEVHSSVVALANVSRTSTAAMVVGKMHVTVHG
jgi:hypothetical protein